MRGRFPRRHRDQPDLDITAFMNLMVVLTPFLLITAVFTQISVLELNIPPTAAGGSAKEELQIEVIVRRDGLEVGSRSGGIIRRFAKSEQGYDYKGLSEVLREIKARYPEKTDATLLAEPDVEYDTIVQVMDAVRTVRMKDGAKTVHAELFPDVSLGDAPAGPAL